MARPYWLDSASEALCPTVFTASAAGVRLIVHAAVAEAQEILSVQCRMAEFRIVGPVVAIVTPFRPDSLRVDDESLIQYLKVLLRIRHPV